MGKLAVKINNKAFATAKAKQEEYGEGVTLDPGRYNGSIIDVRTPKDNLIAIDIKEEESGGRVTIMYSTEEERLVWLLKDLKKFGLEPSDGPELNEALEALKDGKPGIVFSVKEKDGYSNIKIEKAVEGDGEATETAVDKSAGKASAGAKAGSPKADAGKVKPKVTAKKTEEEEEPAAEEEEAAVEEEEPAVTEEEVAISVGFKCKANISTGLESVQITELFEAEEKVSVKVLSGAKKGAVLKIMASKLEV